MSAVPPESAAALLMIQQARAHVAMQLKTSGWACMDVKKVHKLSALVAGGPPERTALAEFLARMTPGALMGGQESGAVLNAAPGKVKLHAAIIESALAEQQHAQSTDPLTSFCPIRVEATFDDWLQFGSFRADKGDSPLTKIATMVSQSAKTAQEDLQTRLGLLVPIIAAVHIWREIHCAPEQIREQLGWLREAFSDADAAVAQQAPHGSE